MFVQSTAADAATAVPATATSAVLAVATMVLVMGCGGSSEESRYPLRYQKALVAVAAAPVPAEAAQRFAAFFQSVDQPGVAARVNALYGDDLYFSDTLFVTEDRAALTRHFERLNGSGAHIDVDVDDAVVSGSNLYLRWRMRVSFPNDDVMPRTQTIGMSQLRFDGSGRIGFQQDFWDSTEGFYRQVPVLGWAIGRVEARMNAEP
jgi:hypothetical protein